MTKDTQKEPNKEQESKSNPKIENLLLVIVFVFTSIFLCSPLFSSKRSPVILYCKKYESEEEFHKAEKNEKRQKENEKRQKENEKRQKEEDLLEVKRKKKCQKYYYRLLAQLD